LNRKGILILTESAELPTSVSPRVQLVNGIIDRAEEYRMILVKGTPACGKTTTMRLVANELLARHSGEKPVHIITGWGREAVEKAGGWDDYLMQEQELEILGSLARPIFCSMKPRSLIGTPPSGLFFSKESIHSLLPNVPVLSRLRHMAPPAEATRGFTNKSTS
jgi:DNA polymerase III delta prime subunit